MRSLLNNSLFLSIQVCKKIADPQTQAYVPVSSERGGRERREVYNITIVFTGV